MNNDTENYNMLKPVGGREESHPFCLGRGLQKEKKVQQKIYGSQEGNDHGWREQELHRQSCDRISSEGGSRGDCRYGKKKAKQKLGANKTECSFS